MLSRRRIPGVSPQRVHLSSTPGHIVLVPHVRNVLANCATGLSIGSARVEAGRLCPPESLMFLLDVKSIKGDINTGDDRHSEYAQ